MDQDPRTILQSLRALMPARGLQHHEAQGVAERQAMRLLAILEPMPLSLFLVMLRG